MLTNPNPKYSIPYLIEISGKTHKEIMEDAVEFEKFVKQEAHKHGVAYLKDVLNRVQREYGVIKTICHHLQTDDDEQERESVMEDLRSFIISSCIQSDDYIIRDDDYDDKIFHLILDRSCHLDTSDLQKILHEQQREQDFELKDSREPRGHVIKKLAHYLSAQEIKERFPLDRYLFELAKKLSHSDLIMYLSSNLTESRLKALPDLFDLDRDTILELISENFNAKRLKKFKSFAKKTIEEQEAEDGDYADALANAFDKSAAKEVAHRKRVIKSNAKIGIDERTDTYRFKYVLDDVTSSQLPKHTKNNITEDIKKAFLTVRAHELTSSDMLENARENLHQRYPHAYLIIDSILNNIRRGFRFGKREIKLKPVLLVGDPGNGKSSLARDLMKALDVSVTAVNVGGMSEDHILGLSSGYSSAMPSVVTTAVASVRTINPCIILDEIDKTIKNSHNGNIVAGLLPLLEPAEAASWYEKFLNLNVDASYINWILTANDIDQVPLPLLSRCTVYRMENPHSEHVSTLAQSIVADYAKEMGVDPRFFSLSADDVEYLRETMPKHRSVRVLRELVRILLDEQESDIFHA